MADSKHMFICDFTVSHTSMDLTDMKAINWTSMVASSAAIRVEKAIGMVGHRNL